MEAALGVIDEALALVGETGESIGSTPGSIASVVKSSSNKPRRPRPRRSRFPRRHRSLAAAKGSQLRAARRAVAGQAVPLHRPPDRRSRRSGAGAARLFADAGVSADRREDTVRGREKSDRRSIMTRATTVGT